MLTVAVVWNPRPPVPSAAVVRPAVADQGPYARGTPFDALMVGELAGASLPVGERVWAWRVVHHEAIAGPPDCEVAMVSLMRRRPGLSTAAFARHWRERHVPIARRRHVGMADYHQFVVVETLTEDTPEIDGVALLGFRTRQDFEERFFDSDEGQAEVMADVARFMDRPGPETTLVGPRRAPVVAG